MNVDTLQHGRNQPFYHVLPDTRDRPGAQLTYVAQVCARVRACAWVGAWVRGCVGAWVRGCGAWRVGRAPHVHVQHVHAHIARTPHARK